MSGVDGILGIGPVDLTVGTLSNKLARVPTVTDNLASTIPSAALSIFYVPTSHYGDNPGELIFGGPDLSNNTSAIRYVLITSTICKQVLGY